MKFKRQIGDISVVTNADLQLEHQVIWLFDYLNDIEAKTPCLKAGWKIQLGWSMFNFESFENGLLILEPDFDSNPLKEWRADISTSLRVQVEQVQFLRRLNVTPVPIRFDDKLTIAKKVLLKKKIYLERTQTTQEGYWFVGYYDAAEKNEEIETLFVFELLHQRPEILKVLMLPIGYMVLFDGQNIIGVANEKDDEIWNTSIETQS